MSAREAVRACVVGFARVLEVCTLVLYYEYIKRSWIVTVLTVVVRVEDKRARNGMMTNFWRV
jgi:hypothetical protein